MVSNIRPVPSWLRFLMGDYSYKKLDRNFSRIEYDFRFCYEQNLMLIDALNIICERLESGDEEIIKLKERLNASKEELEKRLPVDISGYVLA